MFLEAVVADHSLDSKGFTYFVPEHLRGLVRRGCVVEVPFGDELVPAVVTDADAPPPERTDAKAIVGVLVPEPVVHPYQIDTAYAISERYFVFLHTALSFFLNTPVLRRFLKTGKGYCEYGLGSDVSSLVGPRTESAVANPGKQSAGRLGNGSVPPAVGSECRRPGPVSPAEDVCGSRSPFRPAEAFNRTSESNPIRPTLVYDREGVGAAKLFGTRFPAEPGSVLVLPSDAAVEAFLRETALDRESFLVHEDSLTEARDFRLRLAVASRELPFLVWSRKLCSYNLAAYPNVFYFEDSLFPEARHKFFHSYDHIFLFESFARAYPFRLTVSSFVPSSRLMALTAKGDWILENA